MRCIACLTYLCLSRVQHPSRSAFFFFNASATTEIYTLSLHDALPISLSQLLDAEVVVEGVGERHVCYLSDRKSTRLNSSHSSISYAVFCLKKKNQRW